MHVIFDLDGTLVDSRDGIARCLTYALAELGHEIPAESQLTRDIGRPLARCLEALLHSTDHVLIERGVAAYRRRFEKIGILEGTLYAGVPSVLRSLSEAGHDLHVVTAKPSVYARRMLEHFAIDQFFATVSGPGLGDTHMTKEALLREAIVVNGLIPSDAIMVGDRADDILAARQNRVRSIGVAWGYGGSEELAEVRPDCVLNSWSELVPYVQSAV